MMKRIATILFFSIAFIATTQAQTRRSKVDYLQIRLEDTPATIGGSGTIFYDEADSLIKMRMTDGSIFVFGDTAGGGGSNLWQLQGNMITQIDTSHSVAIQDTLFIVVGNNSSYYFPNENGFSISTATDTSIYTQRDTLIETIVIRPTGAISSVHHSGDHLELNVRDGSDSTSSILHIHGNEGFVFEKDKLTGSDSIIFQVKTDTRQIQYYNNPCAGCLLADDGAGLGLLEFIPQTELDAFTIDAFNNMYSGSVPDIGHLGVVSDNLIVGVGSALEDTTVAGGTSYGHGTYVGTSCAAFGFGAAGFNYGSTGIGAGAQATGSDTEGGSIAIGNGAQAEYNSIVIGVGYGGSFGSDTNECIIGTTKLIPQFWFSGAEYAGLNTPGLSDVTFSLTKSTGTNAVGSNYLFEPGGGTGNASTGGNFKFRTSDAGASGTTEQSFTEKVRITKGGDVVILNSANGLVLKDNAGTPHYWRVTVSALGALTTTDLGTTIP